MSVTQIFVSLFAIVSVAISGLAIWSVAKAPEVSYKPLWIIGSLFGFVGFATSLNSSGDLYLQFGVQIPVFILSAAGGGPLVLKALFPIVAVVALARFRSPGDSGISA